MSGSGVIGERIIPEQFRVAKNQYLLYLRHVFAYDFAINNLLAEKSSVLEVGCGSGYGTHLISGKVRQVVGLDVDKNTIGYTSRKYGSEKCRFSVYKRPVAGFLTMKGLTMPWSLPGDRRIQDDLNFVAEAYRVLRPGGVFILTTPNETTV